MDFGLAVSEKRLLYNSLLEGMNGNYDLEYLRNVVNSLPPVHKYQLLLMFLSHPSEDISLKCLPVFLDERTKYIELINFIEDEEMIKTIMEIIPQYGPNIETIDFTSLDISSENKENFKCFLKKTPRLKSLRVGCSPNNCAIYQLLLDEEFNLHEQEVKNGLFKIEYIDGVSLSDAECAKLIKLLPNLKSLGMEPSLGPIINSYSDDVDLVQKLSNITEFGDLNCSLTTLDNIVKLCPNVTEIFLNKPDKKVVENLWKFPRLMKIHLNSVDPEFVEELYNLLRINGRRIKCLFIGFPDENDELDTNLLHELCPKLVKGVINHEIF